MDRRVGTCHRPGDGSPERIVARHENRGPSPATDGFHQLSHRDVVRFPDHIDPREAIDQFGARRQSEDHRGGLFVDFDPDNSVGDRYRQPSGIVVLAKLRRDPSDTSLLAIGRQVSGRGALPNGVRCDCARLSRPGA